MNKINNKIGETVICKNGLQASIIKYESWHNITVKFENGMINDNTQYRKFKNGNIPMPKKINDIKIKQFAYIFNNAWYYICSHPEWSEDKILSVQEIYTHQKTTN